jgi:uncharacterized protein YbbC (DUF1343 family)
MNRRFLLAGGAASLAAACATPRAIPAVTLGVDALAADSFAALRGKRVGLITNQTGVNGAGQLSRVVLKEALGEGLVSLFGPEHGLDTRAKAGDHVDDGRDPVTGLKTWSLYGARRKPTAAMLADLDVLAFDIQDIGVRSYTYISTMALAMEAAAEAGKDFVVLDRPNPLNGARIEGPGLEPAFTSFVSQVPVPYVHGLTVGELARMIVGERWIAAVPRLSVVRMQGWRRTMHWGQTGLSWVATSPNIPFWTSPAYCAATGILGELRAVDIGIGGQKPFQVAAARGIDPAALTRALTAEGFPGVRFAPYVSATHPGFAGVELTLDPDADTDLMALGMALLHAVVGGAGGEPLRATPPASRDLFNKVYGSEALWRALEAGAPWRPLTARWPEEHAAFAARRAPYLLYA